MIAFNSNNPALDVEISLFLSSTRRKGKSHSCMVTCIQNSGYIVSGSSNLGKVKTPNTLEKSSASLSDSLHPAFSGTNYYYCITISISSNPDIEPQYANAHITLALFMHFQYEKRVLQLGFYVSILLTAYTDIKFYLIILTKMNICICVSFYIAQMLANNMLLKFVRFSLSKQQVLRVTHTVLL